MRRATDSPNAVGWALAAITLVGAAVRWVVAGQDLFADELATYWIVSTNDLAGVVDTVSTTAEISPPLGFMLTWLAAKIDLSPEAVRLPALLAGIGSIPVVYAIGLRTVGRGAALAAAAFTALSPFMIFYSAEARGYGVMMFFALLSTLFLLKAVDESRARWWVGYAVCIALAAYTHYTVIFVLGAQFLWALWVHPGARKPLLIATALAAVAYIPWLGGFRGDLDSPTTQILSGLSPFTFDWVKVYVGHWMVGYPVLNVAGLRDLPGPAGLALIAGGLTVGAAGLWAGRGALRAWFAANDNRIVFVVLLALATPVAESLASLLSTNVLSTRNLAASWPYLALATAALITVGGRAQRIVAVALVTAGLGVGAAKMLTTGYERPNYSEVAAWVGDDPSGVLVDAAVFTPGPLANFDLEGSDPGVPVLRLNAPEQKQDPFDFDDTLPDPVELARRAAAEAGGGPITIVAIAGRNPAPVDRGEADLVGEFIENLPPGYRLVRRELFGGFAELQALVYERAGPSASG